ncbi:DUF262 domain-containing protein [Streptomyces sp. CoH27]|uniref:DUF262 domain-containing protein n=1 Tax=Streptomyces sp. CoH27 TaxID=2875763 RepID=UPI001CD29D45|nr:DUF262 domain-containing protein [Streptomyces sp. CoH27]
MSLEDSIGSRGAAREQQSLFSRYRHDPLGEDSGGLRVEVGADGRPTDVELEVQDGEAEDAADRITAPYDPSKIEIQTSNPTINLLMSRLSNGMIDLAPDFQRRAGIWSDEQQSRLIESLLLRIPIPSFYAAELDDSEWAVVDGIQRLTAIARFIAPQALAEVAGIDAGPLRLRGLEYLKDDFEGKRYEDLTGRLQIRLNETQVVVHVIRPGTPEEVKFNIFARINTGGLPLTRQEIRHALIPGPARALLASLAESAEFLSATGGSVGVSRMADREMVLRSLAFMLTAPDAYKYQDFDQFLAHTMRLINRLPEQARTELADRFKQAMTTAEAVFGRHAFRKHFAGQRWRHPVNKALFESVTVNLAELTDAERAALVASRRQVMDGYDRLMANPVFEAVVSVSTGDRARVQARFTRIHDLFRAVLDDNGGSTQ